MKTGKGDFVTYVTLGAVAIIETINETLKLEPHMAANLPDFLTSSLWHFAPLALLCLVGLIWLVKQIGWMGPYERPVPFPIDGFSNWPNPYRPISVVGRTYRNEKVPLDGYSYTGCEFYSVTFVYNGTTPIQFNSNKTSGANAISTDNPAVTGTFVLMKGFNLLQHDLKIDLPSGNIVEHVERKP